MNILIEPHKDVLKKLIAFNIDFILIGGYAVNFHGYNRVTGDMDIWLKPDNVNKEKFLNYLVTDGFDKQSIKHIKNINFSEHAIFHIGDKPLQIEFLTRISGINFEDANANREELTFEDVKLPFLNLTHLILSKITSSRPKDKLDVEELQKIMKLKKGM